MAEAYGRRSRLIFSSRPSEFWWTFVKHTVDNLVKFYINQINIVGARCRRIDTARELFYIGEKEEHILGCSSRGYNRIWIETAFTLLYMFLPSLYTSPSTHLKSGSSGLASNLWVYFNRPNASCLTSAPLWRCGLPWMPTEQLKYSTVMRFSFAVPCLNMSPF